MTESYGVLTVGSVSSGTVADGEEVTGAGVLPLTAIESNLSGTGPGSTWLVNFTQTVASESMTMTAAPLSVLYTAITGDTANRGYFSIQQNGDFLYNSSSLTYATGSAATPLGLTQDSGAYDSTPGQDITSPAAFMNNIVQTEDGQFTSFQSTWQSLATESPQSQAAFFAWAQSSDGLYTLLQNSFSNTPPAGASAPTIDPAGTYSGAGASAPTPARQARIFPSPGRPPLRRRLSTRPAHIAWRARARRRRTRPALTAPRGRARRRPRRRARIFRARGRPPLRRRRSTKPAHIVWRGRARRRPIRPGHTAPRAQARPRWRRQGPISPSREQLL